MFWNKKKYHPLPKFPAEIAPAFKSLCEVLPDSEIDSLKSIVLANFKELNKDSVDNDNIDLRSAEKIAKSCQFLLDKYEGASSKEKGLIIGAVRYCVIEDDPFSDAIFATGFFDDMKIINHVLEELGFEEHCLNIS